MPSTFGAAPGWRCAMTTAEPTIGFYHDHGRATTVNVKDHAYWPADPRTADLIAELGEDTAERVYEGLRESWWEDAETIAQDHGYDGVFSWGRSGGWCGPREGRRPVCIARRWIEDRPMGPLDEYEQEEADPADRFMAFALDIAAAVEGFGAWYADTLRDELTDLECRREANTVRSVN